MIMIILHKIILNELKIVSQNIEPLEKLIIIYSIIAPLITYHYQTFEVLLERSRQ